MFHQIFPVLMNAGVLSPTHVDLVVDNIRFVEAADAKDVVAFDFGLVTATSFSPWAFDTSSPTSPPTPTNAFGLVRQPDTNDGAPTKQLQCTPIFGVAVATQTAGSFGKVRIIGDVTSAPCVSHTNAVGMAFYATGGADTLTACAAPGSYSTTKSSCVKIIAISTSAKGSSSTTSDVFFNGFGFGHALVLLA